MAKKKVVSPEIIEENLANENNVAEQALEQEELIEEALENQEAPIEAPADVVDDAEKSEEPTNVLADKKDDEKKVLLSIKNLDVKFHVRGRILTAIRGISLDIYEGESIAIVGESGSGKSVFTKTFAGMLDSNGFIDRGEIVFSDDELSDTVAKPTAFDKKLLDWVLSYLNKASLLEHGAKTYREILELKAECRRKLALSDEENEHIENRIAEAKYQLTEAINYKMTLSSKENKAEIADVKVKIKGYEAELKALEKEKKDALKKHKQDFAADAEYREQYAAKLEELKARYKEEIKGELKPEQLERNEVLGKEIYLSCGRYDFFHRMVLINKLLRSLRTALKLGVDLGDEEIRNKVFDNAVFRVKFLDGTTETQLHGTCVLNLAKIRYAKDWQKIRGSRIATVFQDPMTSLNPIITIGKQITSIITMHQNCSEVEARAKAVDLMNKVGIPNAENRFDDYPFQYSGGMRQRIVIAIALSCQPKILICDEPTTALDVTIQAQILRLIKDLQKEFGYTIVFITHDLGVVANIAERVAVLYAGQIVELGKVEEVFYDPRHPYTWALLSSLPQLAQKNTKLYSITGTPPSLYNKIVGDPFAPRNPYCLKIDTMVEPPMFKVSDTHYAKTWLLDPRSPQIEKPEIIKAIHEKLTEAFNI
ncbi:MAG: ATP-binding cassette domain-containing protein [Clostridia bacterium]|nr:ATP-binding cassette domain-containing protein [Clostridia bacterium]